MTKVEFIGLLSNPERASQAVDELHRLIEENPYFHTGHQLYIKSLQQSDVKKMELQLSKSALIVRDRGVLYKYLNDTETFIKQISPQKIIRKEIQKEIREEIPEKRQETEIEPQNELIQPIVKEQDLMHPDALINLFLQSEPKIVPNQKSEFQVDLSESLQENKELYTETLADIYSAQGFKEKSIEIYEYLILKYPEKIIYFAAQIKRLKE